MRNLYLAIILFIILCIVCMMKSSEGFQCSKDLSNSEIFQKYQAEHRLNNKRHDHNEIHHTYASNDISVCEDKYGEEYCKDRSIYGTNRNDDYAAVHEPATDKYHAKVEGDRVYGFKHSLVGGTGEYDTTGYYKPASGLCVIGIPDLSQCNIEGETIDECIENVKPLHKQIHGSIAAVGLRGPTHPIKKCRNKCIYYDTYHVKQSFIKNPHISHAEYTKTLPGDAEDVANKAFKAALSTVDATNKAFKDAGCDANPANADCVALKVAKDTADAVFKTQMKTCKDSNTDYPQMCDNIEEKDVDTNPDNFYSIPGDDITDCFSKWYNKDSTLVGKAKDENFPKINAIAYKEDKGPTNKTCKYYHNTGGGAKFDSSVKEKWSELHKGGRGTLEMGSFYLRAIDKSNNLLDYYLSVKGNVTALSGSDKAENGLIVLSKNKNFRFTLDKNQTSLIMGKHYVGNVGTQIGLKDLPSTASGRDTALATHSGKLTKDTCWHGITKYKLSGFHKIIKPAVKLGDPAASEIKLVPTATANSEDIFFIIV